MLIDFSLIFFIEHRIPGFPGHQPELDSEYFKERLNTYETDQRVNYLDPRLKKFPFDLKQMMNDELKAKEATTIKNPIMPVTETQKTNIIPAPIVELEKVFEEEPGNRYYALPVVTVNQVPEKRNEALPEEIKPNIQQTKSEDEEDNLSNFEKLMIRINRNKSARGAAPELNNASEPIAQPEKASKSVHWDDQ